MTDRTTSGGVTLRAVTRADGATLFELVTEALGRTVYRESPMHFLRLAVSGRSEDESRGIVAVRAGRVVGCTLYGAVAGAVGTGRLHFIAVAPDARRLGIGALMCEAAVSNLTARGARNVIIEVPDDPAISDGHRLLACCAFAEVARVPDYYRDGIALIVLNRAEKPSE
jgi:ribosomal protein S18 acetylase RimI-like enzyme